MDNKIENQEDSTLNSRQNLRYKGGVIFIFILIYLLSAGVLAYGAYQYGLFRGSKGAEDRFYQYDRIPSITITPESNSVAIVSNQPSQTRQPESTIKPSVTIKPSLTPTVTPTTSNLINYQYQLPSGWQVVQATDASFEMGFEPNSNTVDLNNGKNQIVIMPKDGGSYRTIVELVSYDGGSRHKFIFGTQPVTKGDRPEKYLEKEFTYEGKNCLFLENVVISMSPTVWGMCDAGGGKGFLVNTWESNYLNIVRSLKRLR